jgi:hypothetical protein
VRKLVLLMRKMCELVRLVRKVRKLVRLVRKMRKLVRLMRQLCLHPSKSTLLRPSLRLRPQHSLLRPLDSLCLQESSQRAQNSILHFPGSTYRLESLLHGLQSSMRPLDLSCALWLLLDRLVSRRNLQHFQCRLCCQL